MQTSVSEHSKNVGSFPGPQAWTFRPGLCGYVWRAQRTRARLLLQHGYAEYAERYVESHSRLVPALVALGITVYAFDMTGHGRSAGRPGLLDVLSAVEDHRAARADIAAHGDPVFLFGHSLGGLITAVSALQAPEGIEGVVLSSPALKIPSSPLLRTLADVLARVAPGFPTVQQGPAEAITRVSDLAQAFAADPRFYRGPLPMRLAASAMRASAALSEGAGQWSLSTLVIHGDADTATDPAGSREFTATIASTDKTYVETAQGRHELLNDLGAEDTLGLVLNWLSSRLA